MGFSGLMRICLLVPSLAGAISVLDLANSHAIEPPIAANTVDTKEETKDHQISEFSVSENLASGSTLSTNLVEPVELLEAGRPQQLNFTPIATQLDIEHSRETEILSSSDLFIPEATPQMEAQMEAATIDTNWLSQVTLVSQLAENRSVEEQTEEQSAESKGLTSDTNVIDAVDALEQPDSNTLEQVTSVTQLSDVQPTDWAFQALQSLVERYGCIAGYPDGTYRGQSTMTRYEFAAGLNACLDRISEFLASSTANLVTQEDLANLQRLQAEFAAELASLRGRVDGLESHVAELEKNQFSTTTRLSGTAIFAVSDVFGDSGDENQMVGQYRASLDFLTSFTGRDLLLTSIWAGNVPPLGIGFNLPGTTAGGIEVPSAEGTLSSEFGANTNNDILLLTLAYTFPVGEQLLVTVAPGGFLPLNLFGYIPRPLGRNNSRGLPRGSYH